MVNAGGDGANFLTGDRRSTGINGGQGRRVGPRSAIAPGVGAWIICGTSARDASIRARVGLAQPRCVGAAAASWRGPPAATPNLYW